MSSTSSPNTERKECPACGYPDIVGHSKCPRCEVELYAKPNKSRAYWFQAALFIFVLLIAAYPYIKQSSPAVERFFEPSAASKRQGDLLFRQGKWKQSLTFYKQGMEKRGILSYILSGSYKRSQSLSFYKMAICSLRLKQTDDSVEYAKKAQKFSPQWMLPYELLLRVHAVKNQKKALIIQANAMKKQFAGRWQMWLVVGNAYGQLMMHKEATTAFEQGLKLHPKSAHLLNNLAWEYLRQNQPKKKEIERARKLAIKAFNNSNKKDFTALDTWAKALSMQGHMQKAINKQIKAIKLAKQSQSAYKKRPGQAHRTKAIKRAIQSMGLRLMLMQRTTKRKIIPPKLSRLVPTAKSLPASRPTKAAPRPQIAKVSTKKMVAPTTRPAPTKRMAHPRSKLPTSRPSIPLPRATHHRRSHKLFSPF